MALYRDAFLDDFPFVELWPEMKSLMDRTRISSRSHEGAPLPPGTSKNAKQLMHTILLLRGEPVAALLQEVITLLVVLYMIPRAKISHVPPERLEATHKDDAFIRVYSHYLDIMTPFMANRQGVALVCPLLLLLIRVVVESIFRELYPNWAGSFDGQDTRRRMDSFLTSVFDPVGFQRHIAVVESSRAAMSILHKRRAPRRMDLAYTSPLTRFIVGDARSKEAQALVSCREDCPEGLSEVKALLTPAVRSKLLHLLATKKMQ